MLKYLLAMTLSLVTLYADIKYEFNGRVIEITDNSSPYGVSIYNVIHSKLPLLTAHNNKLTFRISEDSIDKVLQSLKESYNIPKGVDATAGAQDNSEGNLFLKGFAENSYDTNGIYIGKLSAISGGISKGYILKTYMTLDKSEQKTYKVVEFIRVNFLDELTDIYLNYFKERREKPLFMIAPDQYIHGYFTILDKKLGNEVKPENYAPDTEDKIHKAMLNHTPNPDDRFGIIPILSDTEITSFNGDYETFKTLVKNRLSTLKGALGNNPNMFLEDGIVFNYASLMRSELLTSATPEQKTAASDYIDILNTHMSLATTIMVNHNIRTGYFVTQGIPAYESTINPQVNQSPISHVATERTSGKRWRKKRHWDGQFVIEGDHLFTIQSNDYLNFNGGDYVHLIGADIYENQRVIPTILPFSKATGSPSISHQGHILSHIASFTGYGSATGGTTNPTNRKPFFTTEGNVNSFGNISVGYTSPFDPACIGAGDNYNCGVLKGQEQTKKVRGLLKILAIISAITFIFSILDFLILAPIFLTLAIIIYNKFGFSNQVGNLNNSFINSGANVGISQVYTNVVPNTLNPELSRLLDFSSVYSELFAYDNIQDTNIFSNLYSKRVVKANSTNELPRLKDPANNVVKLTVEAYSKHPKFKDVFSGMDNRIYSIYDQRFRNEDNIKNIIKEYLEGN